MDGIIRKNPKIEPSENGGYIVCYEKCLPASDNYGSTQYMGEGEEVFTDGAAAIKRLDEIAGRQDADMIAAMKERKSEPKSENLVKG